MKGLTAKNVLQNRPAVLLMALLLLVAGPFIYLHVRAGNVQLRSIMLSDTLVSASSSYVVSFTTFSNSNLGSIQVEVCTNDPFPGQPCTAPNGMDWLTSTLTAQIGETGFVVDPSSTANNLILSRAPSASAAGTATSYTLDGVTNPADPATYFVRLQTFASSDGTGPATDMGGLAYVIGDNRLGVNAEVPPFLLFCSGITINDNFCNSVSGNYVDFGNFSSTSARSATTELLVATNGDAGYTITLGGTTMTSGNNTIDAMAVNDVSRPGVSQFGINLRANATPAVGSEPSGPGLGVPTADYNIPNRYKFSSGEIIASYAAPEDTRRYTVSYLVNVNNSQPVGIYVTTVTYVSLANF